MGCIKFQGSKGLSDFIKSLKKTGEAIVSAFTPVKKESGQKYKSDQTARATNSSIKQTSTLRYAEIYEQIGTGIKSVDLKKIFKSLSFLNDADYETIRIDQDIARLDNISYFIYGTPYLWWAIRIANFSKFDTPFSTITAGTNLKVIKQEALFSALIEAMDK